METPLKTPDLSIICYNQHTDTAICQPFQTSHFQVHEYTAADCVETVVVHWLQQINKHSATKHKVHSVPGEVHQCAVINGTPSS